MTWRSFECDSKADALLSKVEIEARLRGLGCYYGADMDDRHELWITPWGLGFWIPIAGPMAPGLDVDHWEEIEADILRTKP